MSAPHVDSSDMSIHPEAAISGYYPPSDTKERTASIRLGRSQSLADRILTNARKAEDDDSLTRLRGSIVTLLYGLQKQRDDFSVRNAALEDIADRYPEVKDEHATLRQFVESFCGFSEGAWKEAQKASTFTSSLKPSLDV